MRDSYFTELAQIDVSEHVERKGKFAYLSWPWAVKTLRTAHPDATWEVVRFDGKPYMETGCGYFVEVAVTVGGITLSQIHPILNNQNRPIVEPNSFDINTSIQRCLVKAIALHGLGLYIYAGEDLPSIDDAEYKDKKDAAATQTYKERLMEQGMSEEEAEKAAQPASTPGDEGILTVDDVIREIHTIDNLPHLKNKRTKLKADIKAGTWRFSGADLNRIGVAFDITEGAIKDKLKGEK